MLSMSTPVRREWVDEWRALTGEGWYVPPPPRYRYGEVVTCPIRHPEPCQKPAGRSSWCDEHDPYRCWECHIPCSNIEAYSTLDTSGDVPYCDDHPPSSIADVA